jgi:phosphatidylglycerophosphatase A
MVTPQIVRVVSNWISSGFGSGYALVAPGTWGSAAALVFWWLTHRIGAIVSFSDRLALLVVTIVVGTVAVRLSIDHDPTEIDPGWIVIDEWAGLYLALLAVSPGQWWWLVCAFVLFRVFDAVKIGPVAWAERLPGAYGIMADDLVAGFLTAAILLAARALMG